MNRLIRVLVLLFLCSVSMFAQDDGVPTTSQECFGVAKAKAGDTISGPQLTALGTFPINNAPLFGSSRFNLSKANATAWVYSFRSSLDRSPVVIVAYKSKATGNCVALEIPTDSSKVAHYNVNERDIQSDSLMLELVRNNTFYSILVQHNELTADSVFLVSSDETNSDLFPPASNVWLITFHHNAGRLTCVYDVTNRTKSVCENIVSGVSDDPEMSHTALILPNPASKHAILHLPSDQVPGLHEIRVFDARGQACFREHNFAGSVSDNTVVLPIENLPSGTYFVHIGSTSRSYTVPLVVQH